MTTRQLRGVIPADLTEQPVRFYDWPFAERVAAAKELDYPEPILMAAVALTVLEQPNKVPNGNCAGLGVWRQRSPWGWGRLADPETRRFAPAPTGFTLAKEGFGNRLAVLLTFGNPDDCLVLVCRECVNWAKMMSKERGLCGKPWSLKTLRDWFNSDAGRFYGSRWFGDPGCGLTPTKFHKVLADTVKRWA